MKFNLKDKRNIVALICMAVVAGLSLWWYTSYVAYQVAYAEIMDDHWGSMFTAEIITTFFVPIWYFEIKVFTCFKHNFTTPLRWTKPVRIAQMVFALLVVLLALAVTMGEIYFVEVLNNIVEITSPGFRQWFFIIFFVMIGVFVISNIAVSHIERKNKPMLSDDFSEADVQ